MFKTFQDILRDLPAECKLASSRPSPCKQSQLQANCKLYACPHLGRHVLTEEVDEFAILTNEVVNDRVIDEIVLKAKAKLQGASRSWHLHQSSALRCSRLDMHGSPANSQH